MKRPTAILGSAIFFVIAPVVLAGFVPWWITGWEVEPPFLGSEATRIAGAVLIVACVPLLVDSFVRFALQGRGTPAPIAPPDRLVVSGLYRHVRNPMYVAIVGVIFGQAIMLADRRLVAYGALFWLASHAFVVLYEEPALRRQFGEDYEKFRSNVPRWFPRLLPWPGC